MATRSKRKKTKKMSLKLGGFRKSKRHQASWFGPSLIMILKVLAVVCVLCGIVIGLMFLEKYVKKTIPVRQGAGELELVEVPLWVSDELQKKVYTIATAEGSNLGLDDAALSVQRNIEELIDFMPMPDLPIVEIKGLPPVTKIPPLGEVWQRKDLAAAIRILDRLNDMDKSLTPDKPLLYEIDRIDVGNFNGLKNSRQPHIILYTKDNTEIIWGAEMGKWQQHLESTDQQKLAKLYGYYKENGTLSGAAKFINLRDPRDNIPLPIDKY